MKKSLRLLIVVPIFLSGLLTGYSQGVYPMPEKKLVEFSHKSPTVRQFDEKTEYYNNCPFDGISLKLSKEVAGGNIFMVEDWKAVSREEKIKEYETVRSIAGKSQLEENMLVLFGASQIDWFSDEDWRKVEDQLRFAVGLAKQGNLKGILWDPEPYKPGKNPWRLIEQPGMENHTWSDYALQVRKRGAQFIQIIQDEFPGVVIFSLREFSDFQTASPFSQALVPVKDIQKTEENLHGQWWSLHLPFTLGIMDAIDEDVTFIDGNEEAYYYTSAMEYFEVRNVINNDMRALIPEGLHKKYKANYYIGHAISTDYIAGNWAGLLNSFPDRLTAQGLMLTPKQRAMWFEHNTYYALRTSDKYAWLYSEGPDWWSGEKVPEGFEEALERAKRKIMNIEPLGFSVDEMLEDARDRAEKEFKRKK